MTNVSENPVAIEITELSKTYRRYGKPPVIAVDKLTLSVEKGQVFGFLGANGAGKTTTIKMLCSLIIPTTGHLRVNGYDCIRQRRMAMRQIGAVLEGTRSIYWRLSAWQNLYYFGRLKGCSDKEIKPRAEQLLRELDLWERRHDDVRFFSRGMQQKVAIACALIADPSIVLLDEPTLGLDIQAARTVKEWIGKLVSERGKTVILTTHQLDIAQELCHSVAIMRKGQLLANQPLSELLHLFREERYQIKLKGRLERDQVEDWSGWSMQIEDGETLLEGIVADQNALHALLEKVYQLGLPLLSIMCVEPDLEDVFLRLIEDTKRSEYHELAVANYVE